MQVLPILYFCSGVISQNENVEFVESFSFTVKKFTLD